MINKEYTLLEAAERLAELRGRSTPYSRQYMYKLIKDGKLNSRKIGQTGTMYVTTEEDLIAVIPKLNKVGRPTNK